MSQRIKGQRSGLGAALHWIRRQRGGLSQRALADNLGVHKNTIIRLESGAQPRCRPDLFRRLMLALHVDPETPRGKILLYAHEHPDVDAWIVRRALELDEPLESLELERLSVWNPGKTA